ncbi:MAG: serine/threonine-protein kinase [Planctomycetota bacterium]|nr:serine/threonine-protein kinase [Planctomycetota bacterium]
MNPCESVDESIRKQFEAAWVAGDPIPLGDALPSEENGAYLATLEELVHIELEFSWKIRSRFNVDGETVVPDEMLQRPPRVESFLERFARLNDPVIIVRLLRQEYLVRTRFDHRPDIEEYRLRFPQLELSGEALMSQLLMPSRASEEEINAARDGHGTAIELGDFGDYELLAEIGRGGMGIVYRARQKSADRLVALKVIRREQLLGLPTDTQNKDMERFRTEAQATASLEHDNIVTVYDVGEVDGQRYYSMRYVDGPSLAEMLSNGPLEQRRAARYTQAAASALEEAHAAGILHRDLKPHNIMLDERQDRALVADFGLAKLVDGHDELTRAGEVMGTPSYMSPEQTQDAGQVTARSDVYSLGATLYHLITARPPFQAATSVETLRQVMDEEPVPPSHLNRAIDLDLETICLKCLQKEPERRYLSARELADDLSRYLERKPILARPVSSLERTLRWCRRNPVVATSFGAAFFFLIVALIGVTYGYATAKVALRETKQSYQDARETVDYFFTQVSENVLLDRPGMQPLREDLLQRALVHYRRFLERREGDKSMRTELGLANYRVGRIVEEIESPERALASYEEAARIQTGLVEEDSNDFEQRQALATTLNAKAGALGQLKRWDAADEVFQRAKQLREGLADDASAPAAHLPEYRRTLANTYMNLGIVERARGNLDDAQANFQQATQIRAVLLAKNADDPHVLRDRAMGLFNLANFAIADDRVPDAEQHLLAAIPIFERLLEDTPDDLMNQHRLATCYRRLGHLHVMVADNLDAQEMAAESRQMRDAALASFEPALGFIELLAYQNPQVMEFQSELAAIHIGAGTVEYDQEYFERADATCSMPDYS